MEKVSFLIPAYNHQDYIAATLNSIAEENYPLKEIVIIDDGSTDNTALAIKQWVAAHPDIEVQFSSRGNKGITATLNELIRQATGKYLRLFSSDDLVVNGSTAILLACLCAEKNKMAVFSDAEVINAKGEKIAASVLTLNGADISALAQESTLKKEIISNWAVAGPVLLIDKNWYERFGYYDEEMLIDDWDLYLHLIKRNALIFCNIKSAQYRRHDQSTCRTPIVAKRIENLKSPIRAVERHVDGFDQILQNQLIAQKYLTQAKIAYLKHRYFRCVAHLFKYIYLRVKR